MRLPKSFFSAIGAATIGSIAFGGGDASAQDDKAKAALLAREAEDLLAQGNVAQACDKLHDSQSLDPRGSTILDLALCREKEGRIGTAYVLFEQAEKAAKEDKRSDRAATAKTRRNVLFLKLARVTVTVPKDVVVPGLEVRIGLAKDPKAMNLVPQNEWGKGFPADPGEVKVMVTAPNKATWETTFNLRASGRNTVTVPALKEGDGPAPLPPVADPDPEEDPEESPKPDPEEGVDVGKEPTKPKGKGKAKPKPTKHEGGRVVIDASVLAGGIGSFLYQAPLSEINGTQYIYKGANESEFLASCGNTTAVPGAGECDATFDFQFGGAFGAQLFLGYAINEDVQFGGRFFGGATYPVGFWVLGGPSISIKGGGPVWGGATIVVGTSQIDSAVTGGKGSIPEGNRADNADESSVDIPVEDLAGRSGETPFNEGGATAPAFAGFEVGAVGEISIMLIDNPTDDSGSGALMLSFWPSVVWAPQHGVVALLPVGFGYRFY